MPYCPNCREEYGEEISACVVCGSDLVDSLADAAGCDGLQEFEPVYSGPACRALEVKALLEEEGCTVYIQGHEDQGDAAGAHDESLSTVRLFVSSDSVVEALEIVDSACGSSSHPEVADGGAPDAARPDTGETPPESGRGRSRPVQRSRDAAAGKAGSPGRPQSRGRGKTLARTSQKRKKA